MAIAFLVCALAWFVDPAAFDPLRWKTSLLLALAPLAFIASVFAGKLRTAAADALPRAFLALALLVLWAIFGAVVHVEPPSLASRPIAALVIMLVVAVLAWSDGFDEPLRLPFAALIAGVPLAALCIAQALGHDPLFPDNTQREAVATFGNTNAAGEFLAPLVPLAVGLAFGGGLARTGALLALPLLSCAVILTASRGAALAAFSSAALVAWFAARRYAPGAKSRLVPATFALACGVLLPLAIRGLDAYSFKSADDAPSAVTSPEYRPNVQRMLLAKASWSMTRAAPVLGHGPGQFEARFPPFRDPEEAKLLPKFGKGVLGSEAEDPHDLYLLLLCEGGVPALALFLVFMLSALSCVSSARILPVGDVRVPVVYGVFGALLAILVVGVFRGVLSNPALTLLAFAFAGQLLAFVDGPAAQPPALRTKGTVVIVALLVCIFGLGLRALVSDLYVRSAESGAPQLDRVERAYDRAFAWDPSHAKVLERRGDVLTHFGTMPRHAADARATWNTLLAQRPYSLSAHVGLAALDVSDGRSSSAWSHLRIVHRLREGVSRGHPVSMLEALEDGGYEFAFATLLSESFAHGKASASDVDMAATAREGGTPAQRVAAATLLDALAAKDPWNGDLAQRSSKLFDGLDDARSREDSHRAQLAYALDHLQDGKIVDARRSLKLAARYGEWPEDAVIEALCAAAEAKSAELSATSIESWRACELDFRQRVLLLDANPDLGPAITVLTKQD